MSLFHQLSQSFWGCQQQETKREAESTRRPSFNLLQEVALCHSPTLKTESWLLAIKAIEWRKTSFPFPLRVLEGILGWWCPLKVLHAFFSTSSGYGSASLLFSKSFEFSEKYRPLSKQSCLQHNRVNLSKNSTQILSVYSSMNSTADISEGVAWKLPNSVAVAQNQLLIPLAFDGFYCILDFEEK